MAKTFILSDESINSYGFRVLTAGINLAQFKKNPVMLFNHRSWGENYSGPIGRWENIRVEEGKLKADAVFDENDEFAQQIASKVEGGFIKGASIGFNIVESSTDASVMVKGQTRATATKCYLYEASVVDMPSNANALALYDRNHNRITLSETDTNDLEKVLPLITPTHKPNTMKLKKETAEQLKLNASEDHSEQQIEKAVETLASERDEFKTKYEDLEKKQKTELTARAEKLVDQAITDKKLTAGDRAEYVKAATENYSFVETALGRMVGVKSITKQLQHEKRTPENGGGNEYATYEEWNLNDPDGLFKLRTEEPEKYNALLNDYKKRLKNPKK